MELHGGGRGKQTLHANASPQKSHPKTWFTKEIKFMGDGRVFTSPKGMDKD